MVLESTWGNRSCITEWHFKSIRGLSLFSAIGCSSAPNSRTRTTIRAAWTARLGRCPDFCLTRIAALRRTSPTLARRVRVMSTQHFDWKTKTTTACTRRYRITSDLRTLFLIWQRHTARIYLITSTARHCWPAKTPMTLTRTPVNGRAIWRWSRDCARAWNDPVIIHTTRQARAWAKTTPVQAHRRIRRRRTRSRPKIQATSPPRTARSLSAEYAFHRWRLIAMAYRHVMSIEKRYWISRFTVKIRISQCRCRPTDALIETGSRVSRSLRGSSCHSTGLFKATRLPLK